MKISLILGAVLALIVACTPVTTTIPPTPLTTPWGQVIIGVPVLHWQTPALYMGRTHTMQAWVGADADEVRLYSSTRAQMARILALKTYYPQDVRLYPASASADTYHVLWLDATQDGETLRLRSALISGQGVALVGALTLSDTTTQAYSAQALLDGTLRLVYSAGNTGDVALYTRTIDAQGRADFPRRLYADAQHPALIADSGGMRVYWLENQRILSAAWQGDTAPDTRAIQSLGSINLPVDDHLYALRVVHNADHAIAFADVRGGAGVGNVWWSSAPIGHAFPPFQPLAFTPTATRATTGYNGGEARRVAVMDTSTTAVTWLNAVASAEASLPTAVVVDDELGVLFWQDGMPYAYQRLVQGIPPQLDAPAISATRDRHLGVLWRVNGAFALTSTRPLTEP